MTIIDDWSGSGQRTTASGTARFEDVEVTAENVVPIWRAYERPSTMGAFAQILHVAIDVGIAAAALRDAADFVRERSRPWAESGLPRAADEPHIIKRFGELHIARDAADALLRGRRGRSTTSTAERSPRKPPRWFRLRLPQRNLSPRMS